MPSELKWPTRLPSLARRQGGCDTSDCHAGEVRKTISSARWWTAIWRAVIPSAIPRSAMSSSRSITGRSSSAASRSAFGQERVIQGAGGRDRRHCRIDGSGAHGIRHEPVWPFMGHGISLARRASMARRWIFPPWRGQSRRALPMLPRIARSLAWFWPEYFAQYLAGALTRRELRKGIIDDIREMKIANSYRDQMRIRCHNVYQETGTLGRQPAEGGAVEMAFTGPDVLILDEPTRGIDVGAKYDIYTIINSLAESGKGVVVISSEIGADRHLRPHRRHA